MRLTRTRLLVLGTVILLGCPGPALASPIATIDYLETSLGGGLFRYDYTVQNVGDPADLYWLTFSYAPTSSLVSAETPADWDLISGPGFVDTFSLLPGAAPLGADVGPGEAQSGFSLVFDSQVGRTAFQAIFTNDADPLNPLVSSGITNPASAPPGPVPEPSSLLLLSAGIGTLAAGKRRRGRPAAARLN